MGGNFTAGQCLTEYGRMLARETRGVRGGEYVELFDQVEFRLDPDGALTWGTVVDAGVRTSPTFARAAVVLMPEGDSEGLAFVVARAHTAANTQKEIVVWVVGDCPVCRQPAPLDPPVDVSDAAATIGRALHTRVPNQVHVCGTALSGNGAFSGQYL